MAELPKTSTCLELTIALPGFTSSSCLHSYGVGVQKNGGGGGVRSVFDINQVPSGGTEEEEWTNVSIEEEEEEIPINGVPPPKKLRLTKEQILRLEESFRQNHTLNPKQKEDLAVQLKLMPRQVEVWFQNRRARIKQRQTEVECAYLRRRVRSLKEQNVSLKREVEELRAFKVGPPTVMTPHNFNPLPASNFSMCPRCQCVTVANPNKVPTEATATKNKPHPLVF